MTTLGANICYAQSHFTECPYAECRNAEWRVAPKIINMSATLKD